MESTTSTSRTSLRRRRIKWDSSAIDQLLHMVSPLLLIAAAVVMTVAATIMSSPKRNVSCFFPKEFTASMYAYGLTVCSTGLGGYYKAKIQNFSVPPEGLDLGSPYEAEKFPEMPEPRNATFAREFLLLAMLCVVPYTAWSLLGKADGLSVLQLSHASQATKMTSCIGSLAWYIITRILGVLAAVVSCVSLSFVTYSYPQLSAAPEMFMCDYWVTRMGGNLHRYTVQCIHSFSNSDIETKDLTVLRSILFIWFIGLTVILALNALFTIIVCVVSFLHGFRKTMLHKMISVDSGRTDDVTITPHQAFVIVMAARNGYGQEVSEILTSQAESIMSKME